MAMVASRSKAGVREKVSHFRDFVLCDGRENGITLLTQPLDTLRLVLSHLPASDLASVACTCRRLCLLASEDAFWRALLVSQLPRMAVLLEAAPAPGQPTWWAGRSWRQRLAALACGACFQAQVFNREMENEAEDFHLSAYDATCCLDPASRRALLAGGGAAASRPLAGGNGSSASGVEAGSSGPGDSSSNHNPHVSRPCSGGCGGSAGNGPREGNGRQPATELRFTARYLPMGGMKAVAEAGVAERRLRLPPHGSSPHAVFSGGSAAATSAGLSVGDEVEVQWKGRRAHPFGWWFGTVQSVRGDRIALLFRQYPRSSVWHRVRAPIKPGREAVVNGDCSFGYVGGLRRLSPEERDEWRRHGAPHPPAPALLQALADEAAAEEDEEDWGDEEELPDIDAELAAQLEEEEEVEEALAALLAPAGLPAAGAAAAGNGTDGAAEQQPAPPAAVGAGDGTAGTAAALQQAALGGGPAAPPGEPIALHLGHAAAAASAAAVGTRVELAAAAGASQPTGSAAAAGTAVEGAAVHQ